MSRRAGSDADAVGGRRRPARRPGPARCGTRDGQPAATTRSSRPATSWPTPSRSSSASCAAPDVVRSIPDVDRANLAKYLTIAKLKLENAIAMVRSGDTERLTGSRGHESRSRHREVPASSCPGDQRVGLVLRRRSLRRGRARGGLGRVLAVVRGRDRPHVLAVVVEAFRRLGLGGRGDRRRRGCRGVRRRRRQARQWPRPRPARPRRCPRPGPRPGRRRRPERRRERWCPRPRLPGRGRSRPHRASIRRMDRLGRRRRSPAVRARTATAARSPRGMARMVGSR